MRIKKFIITNYRAIEKIEFSLNFSINPIIGVNEAGKTSVLRAILAFDNTRDKLNGGEHLDFKNKYIINPQICTISALILLDSTEIKELVQKLNIQTDSDDFKEISKLDEKYEFLLTRDLSDSAKKYSIYIEKISTKTLEGISKYLISKIPYILYFDDFADRVPEEITFNDEYINDAKLTKGKI